MDGPRAPGAPHGSRAGRHAPSGRQRANPVHLRLRGLRPVDDPGAGRRAGQRARSGRLLSEIVRSLPARPVDLTTDGTRTTVKCGSATFTLMLLPLEEYPTLPDMPDTTGTIGADAFASAIHQVGIAAGKDDTLPALTGIRMEINEDTLTMVATDRYRLAVRELRWTPVAPGLNTAVLVPARVLGDTARQMTGGAEVSVALATTEGGNDGIIGFEGSGRKTTTRLLSGEYPRYQTLLPSEFSAVAELPAAPFADAVERVALVAERNTPVRLTSATGEVLLEAAPATRPRRARRSAPASTARRCRSRSTDVPARRHQRRGLRHGPHLVHDGDQARRDHRQGRGAARLPLRPHAHPLGWLARDGKNACHRLARRIVVATTALRPVATATGG